MRCFIKLFLSLIVCLVLFGVVISSVAVNPKIIRVNFEDKSFGIFHNVTGENALLQDAKIRYDWKIGFSGKSSDYGPMSSYNPCYAYIDATNSQLMPGRQGEDAIAYLESDTIDEDIYYVEFPYHMHGKDIGSLALEYFDGNSWKQVWIEERSQGRKWKRATINLLPYNTKKIRFVGRSFYGKPE